MKKDRDGSSTLYSFIGPFQLLHADTADGPITKSENMSDGKTILSGLA